MKNKYLINALKGLAMILMTASLVNCSKSSSGGSKTSSNYGNGYRCYTSGGGQVDNSQCLNNPYTSYYYCLDNNGNSVSNTSCYANTSTSSAYTLQNGRCYYNNGSHLQEVAYSSCSTNGNGSYPKQNCLGNTYRYGNQTIKCGYQGMPGATHICPTDLVVQTTTGTTVQCL